MDHTLQLHEFFVEGGDPGRSHVLLNLTEPSTAEEKKKGYFFALCEIDNAEMRSITKLQNTVDEIENSYYEIPDSEDKNSLEIILEKINQETFTLAKPEISLHCLVGAIRWPEIIFSFHGKPHIVLFYKNKEGEYKQMDLSTQEGGEKDRQLFSQIIQGKIGPHDYFFLGTPHITEYFERDRLQKIITTRPPRQSAEHLQRVLGELKNDLSFGGIIINSQKSELLISKKKIRTTVMGESAESLSHLFNTEQKTASILSSSLFPKIQEKFASSLKNLEQNSSAKQNATATVDRENFPYANIESSHLKQRQSRTERTKTPLIRREHIILTGKLLWQALKLAARALLWISVLILQILIGIGRNALLLFFVATNYQNRRRVILLQWNGSWNSFKSNIHRLPLMTKILVVLSTIVVLVFVGSIFGIRIKQQNAAKRAAYQTAVQSITAKKDAAESALIYKDDTMAMNELRTASEALAELPCKSDEEKATCDSLREKIGDMLSKVRKITNVNAQTLATFESPNSPITRIVKVNNKIVGYGSSNSSLFIYDLLTKENRVLTPSIAEGFTSAAVPKENDYVAFLYDKNQIAELNPADNSIKRTEISFPETNSDIKDIVIYNRRLYSLDAGNNQIYRHDAIKTGFERGKPWIQDSTVDVRNGISFAIEGDVYVLNNNGTVTRLVKGQVQPFTVQGLDPVLTAGTQLWSYTDLEYIYILDTANKRVIIFDKTGQLKSQITAPQFKNPAGMIIDEPKGIGYIIDSNILYQIPL